MFTQQGELMMVDFRPGHFPYDDEIIQTFFPNRQVLQDNQTYWFGVICSMSEWEAFMTFAEESVRQDENPIGTSDALEAIGVFRSEHNVFKGRVATSPFKRPMDWGRIVA